MPRRSTSPALARGAALILAVTWALCAQGADPPYPHGAFREECSACHAPDSWKPARIGRGFDHAKYGMALAGAHSQAACRSCHLTLEFTDANPTCVACHQDIHVGELGTDCARCHSTRAFNDHAAMVRLHLNTRFPLTGSHVATDCEACHKPAAQGNFQFVNTPVDCLSCHLAEFQATRDPDHVAGGFPTECAQCHDTLTWTRARFDHGATRFPLSGAHVTTPCASCHGDGVYHGKSILCVACHQQDYNTTSDPNHQAASFPTTCQSCHTTTTWVGAGFNHAATQFPLTGAHVTTPCASCHGDGVYDGKSSLCVACHQQDYNTTSDPNHQAAGFPTTCQNCHTTNTWNGASFNHAATQFPLTGAHVTTPCASCHGDGVYDGKSSLCVACHQQDYNTTNDPNHQAASFPTTCQTCHTTITWVGASFNHAATQFPLTGAHVATPCASCHGDGVYDGKSSLCVACHQQDYNTTNDPNHQAAGYPTTCQTCHTTVSWQGATDVNHDAAFFPIYSGAHRGEWSTCTECHTSPASFAVFNCLLCHEHSNATQVGNHHQGVGGYAYESHACYNCHPRGRAD